MAEGGVRQKGLTIVKPIVYGNIARYFGKREEDGHTHRWTVYVKPYKNEDMSVFVKKVHFKLHESYANFNRVVSKPPYEVTETGWGEFEVAIKIYFNDANERPLFQHADSEVMSGKKALVTEFYDEVIVQDPTAAFQQMLMQQKQLQVNQYKHETDFEDKKTKTIANIQSAKTRIRSEISDLNDRLKQSKEAIGKLREAINKVDCITPITE